MHWNLMTLFTSVVSKELKIHSRKEFYEQMMESYGAMPKIYFRASSGVEAHTEFYVALLARKNYFCKCLELLSIHSAAFCPRLKGEKGLVGFLLAFWNICQGCARRDGTH
jgi:hypothetical protein